MGRKSSITRLPLPVRKSIDDALKRGSSTLDEIIAAIRDEFGADVAPSRSALGRYSMRFEEVGKKLRESREVAQVWADRLGKEPEGDVAKLVMEMLRTLAFDATMSLSDGSLQIDSADLKNLSLVMQRLEAAGKWNLQREQAMRKAVLEEAASKVDEMAKAKKAGLTPAMAEQIKREFLGIKA